MKRAIKYTGIICCFVLAGIFLWSGVAKVMDPGFFAEGIAGFRVFPEFAINLLAISVPILELLVALLLLTKWWRRQAALLSCLLAGVFVFLFLWAMVHGQEVDCACFGKTAWGRNTQVGLWRAAGILLLSLMAYGCLLGDFLRNAAKGIGRREIP